MSLLKGLMLGAAALVAVVTVAVEYIRYRQVPQPYSAQGQRRNHQ